MSALRLLSLAVVTSCAASVCSPAAQADELYHERVEAYSSEWGTWDCTGSGWLVVEMQGDGDTDLDLFIYDPNGNEVGSDQRFDDFGRVRVFVRRGQEYMIEVRNLGNVWNAFTLRFDKP